MILITLVFLRLLFIFQPIFLFLALMDLLLHLFLCVSWKTDVIRKVILFQAWSKSAVQGLGFSIARFIIQVVPKIEQEWWDGSPLSHPTCYHRQDSFFISDSAASFYYFSQRVTMYMVSNVVSKTTKLIYSDGPYRKLGLVMYVVCIWPILS